MLCPRSFFEFRCLRIFSWGHLLSHFLSDHHIGGTRGSNACLLKSVIGRREKPLSCSFFPWVCSCKLLVSLRVYLSSKSRYLAAVCCGVFDRQRFIRSQRNFNLVQLPSDRGFASVSKSGTIDTIWLFWKNSIWSSALWMFCYFIRTLI